MLENEFGDIVASNDSTSVEVEVKEPEAPETIEAEPEKAEEENNTEGEEVRKKRPSGFQRKITKLEQENATLTSRLAALEKPAMLDKEPNLDDYPDLIQFNRDVIRYENHQAELKRQAALTEQAWQAKIESLDDDKWGAFQKLQEDYRDVNIRTQIINSAKKSDIGPDILLHLDKNPDLFDKLNDKNTSDLSIKRSIAAIEEQLKGGQKPAVKGTKSPAPITPVKGSSPTSVDDNDLDTDAFIAKYHPTLLKKR